MFWLKSLLNATVASEACTATSLALRWWQFATWLFSDVFKVNALMSLLESSWELELSAVPGWRCEPDPPDGVSTPQQPEGRPCGDEPRREEADAGEIPQHEQVWGHQRAPDEVRFFQTGVPLPNFCPKCSALSQGGEPVRKRSGTRRRAQHHRAAPGLLRQRKHGVAAERRPPDRGGWAEGRFPNAAVVFGSHLGSVHRAVCRSGPAWLCSWPRSRKAWGRGTSSITPWVSPPCSFFSLCRVLVYRMKMHLWVQWFL